MDAYEQLDVLFALAEKKLKALHPTRSVYIGNFGFDKVDYVWRIVVGGKPVANCTRQERIHAANNVRQLHDAVLASINEFEVELQNAIQALAQYVEGK